MPGRPEFSQPGTQGGGQTVATQERPDVTHVSNTQTGSVASSNDEITEFYAPAGSVYYVKSWRFRVMADADATTGSHYVALQSLGNVNVVLGRSDYNKEVHWNNSHWVTADAKQEPANEGPALQAVLEAIADETSPLTVRYKNSLDVAQENDREIEFLFEEVSY